MFVLFIQVNRQVADFKNVRILSGCLQTMLAGVKLEVMAPSAETPDQGQIGRHCFSTITGEI